MKKEMHLKNIMNYSMEEGIVIIASNMWYAFLGIKFFFCGAYLFYTWNIFKSKFQIKVGMLSIVRILKFKWCISWEANISHSTAKKILLRKLLSFWHIYLMWNVRFFQWCSWGFILLEYDVSYWEFGSHHFNAL